jgi:outer membrane protein assembly factor BamB
LGKPGQSDYGQEYVGTQYTKTKWTSSTGGVVQGSPVIDSSGTIYITSGNDANTAYSNVYAVNPNTGAKIWQKTLTDNYADSTPAISDSGTVYVNTLNHVYALNPSNGATLYNYDLSVKHPGDSFSTSPTITTNGNIIIGGINGYIYALSPTLTESAVGCYD